MAVSKKITGMMEKSSWIRKMFETGAKLKAEYGADNVFDFSLGNPNLEPPEAFKNTLIDIVNEEKPGRHSYMPNAGYPEVCRSIAEYLSKEQGTEITEKHVIMTCGAGGALNIILKTIINPGDNILASAPCFMEYAFYADNHGGSLKIVPCRDDFNLDLDAINANITEKTAGIIINSPNNPSGKIYPASYIEALGKLLEDKSRETGRTIYLISDEPYRKIVFDNAVVPGIFKYYKNSMIVTSCSKDLSIPGERIGWLAVHPQADDVQNIINGSILCNRILGYVNAPALMQRVTARIQGVSVDADIYKQKRDTLCTALSEIGYDFIKPEGTFYLFPRAPQGDDIKFVNILQSEKILTVPGQGFGLPGFFRIAFCVEDSVIRGSIKGFARAFYSAS